jgi:hypothetical protein
MRSTSQTSVAISPFCSIATGKPLHKTRERFPLLTAPFGVNRAQAPQFSSQIRSIRAHRHKGTTLANPVLSERWVRINPQTK